MFDRYTPDAWRQIVESDQIDILAFAVLRHLEQIDDAQEARLAGQLPSDIRKTDWLDRIHLDLTFFHPVPVADLDVGAHPYSDAASDLAATNTVAEALGEHHEESLHPVRPVGDGGGRSRAEHPRDSGGLMNWASAPQKVEQIAMSIVECRVTQRLLICDPHG